MRQTIVQINYIAHLLNRYPEVVQRQNMLWDAKSQQLNKMLKVQKDDKKPKGSNCAYFFSFHISIITEQRDEIEW